MEQAPAGPADRQPVPGAHGAVKEQCGNAGKRRRAEVSVSMLRCKSHTVHALAGPVFHPVYDTSSCWSGVAGGNVLAMVRQYSPDPLQSLQ
jgi:hypothetical protein